MKMLKATFLLLVTCISYSNSFGQSTKKSAWEYDELKGKVKKITTTTYEGKDTLDLISNAHEVSNSLIRYNLDGNWVEFRSFNADHTCKWSEHPQFDENGRSIIRHDYSHKNSDSTLVRTYVYKNDRNGNIVEAICTNSSDSLLWKHTYIYDGMGNILVMQSYSSPDILAQKCVYRHSNTGLLMEEINADSNNSLQGRVMYKYDNQGQKTEKLEYNSRNSLKDKITYKYNEQGSCIEECTCNSDGTTLKRIESKYKYDSRGNWTERIDYLGSSSLKKTVRNIDYF